MDSELWRDNFMRYLVAFHSTAQKSRFKIGRERENKTKSNEMRNLKEIPVRKPYLQDRCILNDVNEINTDVHTVFLLFSISIHWVSFFLVTLISSVSELTWTCFIVLPLFSLHLVCAHFFRNSTLLRMDFLLFLSTIHIFRGQSFILLSNKRMHCKQQYGTVRYTNDSKESPRNSRKSFLLEILKMLVAIPMATPKKKYELCAWLREINRLLSLCCFFLSPLVYVSPQPAWYRGQSKVIFLNQPTPKSTHLRFDNRQNEGSNDCDAMACGKQKWLNTSTNSISTALKTMIYYLHRFSTWNKILNIDGIWESRDDSKQQWK